MKECNQFFLMQGDPYDFLYEKWATHLHHPQPNLRDHLVEGNHIDENVDMVGLVNDAFAMANQVVEDIHNPLMEKVTQDGDHAMGGREVEDNHDLNDQEHVMEEEEKANEQKNIEEGNVEPSGGNLKYVRENEEDDDITSLSHGATMNFEQQEFEEMAKISLHENFQTSSLCVTLLILNCCQTHGTSNVFITELLGLLKKNILPTPNTLFSSEYEAFNMLKKLCLAYNVIDVCEKGCTLLRGDLGK